MHTRSIAITARRIEVLLEAGYVCPLCPEKPEGTVGREEEETSQLLRVAAFNVEALDDKPGDEPTLAEHIAMMHHDSSGCAHVLCL